jgi:hypothetical protein
MAGIGRAPEGSAPVSRLHQLQSFDPADFPVPTGRQPPDESARAGDG